MEDPGIVAPACRAVDAADAGDFLRGQASVLAAGLCGDAHHVVAALHRHEECHPTWLALLAALREQGDADGAADLAALYAFHGRVAGALEQGPEGRLYAAAAEGVRRVLTERLAARTSAALALLPGSAPGDRDARAARAARVAPAATAAPAGGGAARGGG